MTRLRGAKVEKRVYRGCGWWMVDANGEEDFGGCVMDG